MSSTSNSSRQDGVRVSLQNKMIGMLAIILTGAVFCVGMTGLRVTLLAFFAGVSLFNLSMSAMEVRWRIHTSRTPEASRQMQFPEPTTPEKAGVSFALIVPALREAAVLGHTLRNLAETTYHNVRVYATLRTGDRLTIKAATIARRQVEQSRRAGTNSTHGIRVVTRKYEPHEKGKPYQLNHALKLVKGEKFVGVVDAEDDVHPELLAHVAKIVEDNPDVDIVQAGVQLMNLDLRVPEGACWWQRLWIRIRGWFCLHNVLEYFFWFSSRMFYQVAQGVVPLGGNTVFIRRSLLEEIGGWPTTLTEDCALGIRAAALKQAKVIAIYDPRLVTREETPDRLFIRSVRSERKVPRQERAMASTLVTQRTRWDQGFLQEIWAGHWRELPTFKQRVMAAYILGMPFIQAFNGIMLPLSIIAAIWLVGPVPLVLFMFMPLVPLFMTLTLQLIALVEFSALYDTKLHLRHYVSLVVGFYPYQLVLAWAAIIAMRRLIAGHNDWALTSHSGLHRSPETSFTPREGMA